MAEKRQTGDAEARRLPDSFRDGPSTGLGPCGWILVAVSFLFTVITFPISIWMCIKIIKEYERAIIFRLGRILQGGAKGPGLFFILPCTDSFIKVDMRTISFDIPPQEILTKDSVTISVDGVVYYRVQNATLAVANITNADSATRLLAQTTLRNVLGTKNLSQILSDREEIAHNMQCTLDDATDDWGIKVERVEIKDVKLPVQLQRAMAAEAEASREARAKVALLSLLFSLLFSSLLFSSLLFSSLLFSSPFLSSSLLSSPFLSFLFSLISSFFLHFFLSFCSFFSY
ncbi:stomatin isoform X1 [Ursus arctos]|uniref:stomatin isoform X1 n=1 Tax=Ursus arctos TaxID=9644 RepID=UPI0025486D5B|nr:stomatin isoform X1 [Ursus arctos]